MSSSLFPDDVKAIEVYTSSLQVGKCHYDPCTATITWGQVVKSGALMCFTGPLSELEVLRTGSHNGRQTTFLRFDANHWWKCPGAPDHKKKGKP